MERLFPDFQLITQNVDGLHQRAGSCKVIELHGNIARSRCFEEGTVIDHWKESTEVPPRCPQCGGHLRPDVVWFDEPLPQEQTFRAFQLSARCEVFLSIGTSTVVQPAALLPFEALHGGATVVEINPQRTPLTASAHYVLPGPAGTQLPKLLEAIREHL